MDSANTRIRVAGQADVDSMISIYEAGLLSALATGCSPSTMRLQLLTSIHESNASHVIVAEQEGKVIAWASLSPMMDAHPAIGLGEIRAHADPAYRMDGFEDALFWDVESAAVEKLYLSLRCYAPARKENDRCACERFKYWERFTDEGRSLFGYDSGRTIVYEKQLVGVSVFGVP